MINQKRYDVYISRIHFSFNSTRTPSELGIENHFKAFCLEEKNILAHVDIDWAEEDSLESDHGQLIYDPGLVFKVFRKNDNFHVCFSYFPEDSHKHSKSILESNSEWNKISIVEKYKGNDWISHLATGIGEMIIRTSILFTKGLMIHSAGIDDHGKGIVFVGHSGAGKSTQARLWSHEKGVIAINDDRMAVRIEESGPVAYGNPWGGSEKISINHSVPLSAFVLIEKSPVNSISRLSPVEAASLMMARSFFPYWDERLLGLAIENLDSVLKHVPVYRLNCRPENEVIPLVRSVL